MFICQISQFLNTGKNNLFFFQNTTQTKQDISDAKVWLPGCQFSTAEKHAQLLTTSAGGIMREKCGGHLGRPVGR